MGVLGRLRERKVNERDAPTGPSYDPYQLITDVEQVLARQHVEIQLSSGSQAAALIAASELLNRRRGRRLVAGGFHESLSSPANPWAAMGSIPGCHLTEGGSFWLDTEIPAETAQCDAADRGPRSNRMGHRHYLR